MTTITVPRALLEQALEALIIAWQQQPRWQITESMHNLRAALAQQAEPFNLCDPAVRRRLATQWGYVPPRLSLTEEVVSDLCDVYKSPRQLVRAVERAHEIKE